MNSTPPAVMIGPPSVGVPVFGTPFAVNSLYPPNGTRHTISPVVALTAISSPHGGALHGYPFWSSNGIFRLAYDGRTPEDILGFNFARVPTLRVFTKM